MIKNIFTTATLVALIIAAMISPSVAVGATACIIVLLFLLFGKNY